MLKVILCISKKTLSLKSLKKQFMDVPKRNSKAQAATCYTTMTIDPNPISIPYIPE